MKNTQIETVLTKVLSLPSFEPSKSEVPTYLFQFIKQYTENVKIIKSKGIKNIVAITPGKARILFNGHWDTVLPDDSYKKDILEVTKDKDSIYGLGACDMKSGLVSMITAFIECIENNIGGVTLCLVGDEELGGENGTHILVQHKVIAPNVILGEPTNLAVSLGQKNGMVVKLTASGISAHGAYPHRGKNAITKLMKALLEINTVFTVPRKNSTAEKIYFNPTASINLIEGGTATNSVPSSCTASIDVRFPPTLTSDSVKKIFLRLGKKYDIKVEFELEGKGWMLDKKSKLFSTAQSAVKTVTKTTPNLIYKMGTNDGKYYAPYGCNIVNIGPGDNRLSHTTRERVRVGEVVQAKNIYLQIAKNI